MTQTFLNEQTRENKGASSTTRGIVDTIMLGMDVNDGLRLMRTT